MTTVASSKREVIDEIVATLGEFAEYAVQGEHCIPAKALELLRDARLDNYVSLARNLRRFIPTPTEEEEAGTLILAWATLGSLIEGTMKFFLCVHERDYTLAHKKNKMPDRFANPDALALEALRVYHAKEVWEPKERRRWEAFILMVQQRRNAIHPMRQRDLGDMRQFWQAVRDVEYHIPPIDDPWW